MTPRHAALSFLNIISCIGWRKNNRTDRPISYMDTLLKTSSGSIEAVVRRRRTLFAGFVARMGNTRLPKCMMFGELMGGVCCLGGRRKKMGGLSPGRRQSFRHQRRPVEDRSPGGGGMAQDGGARSGMFHDEMDRRRKS